MGRFLLPGFVTLAILAPLFPLHAANKLGIAPSSVTYPDTRVSTGSASQAFTLSYLATGGTATIHSISVLDTTDFSVASDLCTGVKLSKTSPTCTFAVRFTPGQRGVFSTLLEVVHSIAAESPIFVPLSGRGVEPQIAVAPAALSFGDQTVGTPSAARYVTVTNSGDAALAIDSIAVSGDFSQTNTCPATLAAGLSCSIATTFTPAATGSRTGNLTIVHDATNSPATVALSGNGISPGSPDVTLSTEILSFASQIVNTTSTPQTVVMTNTSSVTLTISAITISGNFSVAHNCGASLAGLASCYLNVTFTPTAAGTRTGTLSITDNATDSPQQVALSGNGTVAPTPVATLTPTSVAFGDQVVGTTGGASNVTLTNTGLATLTVNTVDVSGPFAQTNTCISLSPGGSCPFSVTFTPTALGALNGAVSITDNAPGSPHRISLTGIGVSPGGPDVSLSTALLDFSRQAIGQASSAQTVVISNIGGVTLNINSIAVSGGSFAQSATTCGSTLAAQTSCTASLIFTPATAGVLGGLLTITDDASDSPQTVTLQGTGVAFLPAVTLNPASVDFGHQTLNQSGAARAVTVTNTGNAALTITGISTGAPFSQTNTCTGSLPAGISCTISATFTPTALGSQGGAVTITSNASSSPDLVVLSGTGIAPGTPDLSLSTDQLIFAAQDVGTTSGVQNLVLSNTGTVTVTLTGITVSGHFAATNGCGSTLASLASCQVGVTFTPTEPGSLSGTITVTDDASDSPQTVALSGVGIIAPVPESSLSASLIDFGAQPIDVPSAARTLTITSSGTAPLRCESATLGPDSQGDFGRFSLVDHCSGETLAVDQTCTMELVFNPGERAKDTAILDIVNDAPDSPFDVTLTGTGSYEALGGGGGCSLVPKDRE